MKDNFWLLKSEVLKWPKTLLCIGKEKSLYAYTSPNGCIFIEEDYVERPSDKEEVGKKLEIKCANCKYWGARVGLNEAPCKQVSPKRIKTDEDIIIEAYPLTRGSYTCEEFAEGR